MSARNYTGVRTASQERKEEACIVSEGRVGHDVASRLSAMGISVTLIDTSPPIDPPPGLNIHRVTSLDETALSDANIRDETTVLAVAQEDSKNLLIAQVARTTFGVGRVIVRVNDPRRTIAFADLDHETIEVPSAIGQSIAARW